MSSIDRYSKVGADIKVQRSRFPMNRRVSYSYFHGFLHPVGSPIEVLPGDTFKASLSAFVRMSTPIVPFIDDVRAEYDAFFVPKRILWDKTKHFYGESPSFGIASAIEEPTVSVTVMGQPLSSLNTNILKSESFAGAFGIVINAYPPASPTVRLNVLPFRSLLAIYNEYYRNENYQDQYTWDKSQYGNISNFAYLGGTVITGFSFLPKVNKDGDLITSILPYQVKGAPVTIGLAGSAPVIAMNQRHGIQQNTALTFKNAYTEANYTGSNNLIASVGELYEDRSLAAMDSGAKLAPDNLFADLSNATAISISDLLYAFAYQDFLARAAHFGTRYKEYIYSMFGTVIADATEDIPEYLGRLKFNINVNQVVQTTGFNPSSSTELGSLGAYSVSGDSKKLFTKSFTEPGYVVIVGYTKHKRTYSSGVDRVFIKRELLDYYQPPFANIPDVPFDSLTIWLNHLVSDVSSLGFQEPFWDNRVLLDRTYGLMNPMVDTLGQLWTLGENWTTKPSITGTFMKEDREAIARVLVTGTNGPDYLIDTVLNIDATRVMPLYSSGKLGRF